MPAVLTGDLLDVETMTKAQCRAWLDEQGLTLVTLIAGGREGRRFWASDGRGRVGPLLFTYRDRDQRLRVGDLRRLIAALQRDSSAGP
jgi:hypothetical protein